MGIRVATTPPATPTTGSLVASGATSSTLSGHYRSGGRGGLIFVPDTVTPAAPQTQSNAQSPPVTPPSADDGKLLSDEDILQIIEQLFAQTGTINPLNDKYQVAYHWKLFMVNDMDLYTQLYTQSSASVSNSGGSNDLRPNSVTEFYNRIDALQQTVIAETGSTTYNIKSVETRALIGPNPESKNINVYKFSINIVEPISIGFLNALKLACVQSRIRNIQKTPYYLELKFLGYDELGNALPDALVGSGLDSTRWIWQIQLIDIDTKFDASGGQYQIEAQVYNDGALDDDTLATPQILRMTGGNIGEMLDSLGKNMTDSWNARYGTGDAAHPLIQYKFIMHPLKNPPRSLGGNPDPNSYRIKPQQPNLSSIRADPMNGQAGAAQATIVPGTGFNDIVDWLLNNNEQSHNLVIDRDNELDQTDTSASQTNDRDFKEALIPRIETDIQITGYDYVTANYTKNIYVHIFLFYTQAILTGPVQREDARNGSVQATMVKKLIAKKFLQKHYDYLFTGLNTEVIDFDVTSSFKWNALLPRLFGERQGLDNTEVNALMHKTPEQLSNDELYRIYRLEESIRNDLSKQIDDLTNKINDNNALINNSASLPSDIKTAQNTNSTLQPQLDELVKEQSDQTSLLGKLSSELNQRSEARQALFIKNSNASTSKRVYAEELVDADGRNNTAPSAYQYEDFNYAVSFRQGYRESMSQSGTGFIGPAGRDKSVFGSLIDQLYQPLTTQLARIELSIRGDPYWLGSSNLQRQMFLRFNNNQGSVNAGDQDASTNLPNFVSGDQTFLLTFRFPIAIDDNFVPIFKTDDTFNGIYRATEVVSTFSDGVFTQKLTGNILPLINSLKALKNLNGTSDTVPSSTAPQGNNAAKANPTKAASAAQQSTPRPTTAQQQQNAAAFKSALIAKSAAAGIPLTDAQADGIVANAYRESSMNPGEAAIDSNGKISAGLMSWNGERYNAFQTYTGVTPNNANIDQQADYVVHELQTTESSTYTQLQQTSTAAEAANVWVSKYERPLNPVPDQNINLSYLPHLYPPS